MSVEKHEAREQLKEFRLQLEADWQSACQEAGHPSIYETREHYWMRVEKLYCLRAAKWCKGLSEALLTPVA